MNVLSLNQLKTLWKTLAVCAVAVFLAFSTSFLKGGFFGQYHDKIMLGLFAFVFALSGSLIAKTLKALRLQHEQIEGLMGIELALISLIDLKDPYTEGHSRNVRDLSRRFAEYLEPRLPEFNSKSVEEITTAAELHDIGKIGVPDSVLKKDGKLTDMEFLEIKKHPSQGANSLQSLKGFENIARAVRHHHEKYDGSGYPDGLSGMHIPLESRIISILDTYDAMTHDRSYRKAMKLSKTLEIMKNCRGSQFDPELLNAFIDFIQSEDRGSLYDLVCGMTVNPTDASFRTTYQNQIYLFCSALCKKEFDQDPNKFINNSITGEKPPNG